MEHLDVAYVKKFPDDPKVKRPEFAVEHRPFMDLCHYYGLKVILPIVQDETLLTVSSLEQLQRYIEARIDQLGNHPALLMWAVGNELPLAARADLRDKVNWSMWYIRKYMRHRWGRSVPVTTVTFDYPPIYEQLIREMIVDVFSVNSYRGLGLHTLWEDPGAWFNSSQKYGVPLLITEFGVQNQPTVTAQTPDWPNRLWREIVLHMPDGCIGATYFELTDDPSKPSADQHLGLMEYTVAVEPFTGRTSMDPGAFIADNTRIKPIVYGAFKYGHPGSPFSAFNFRADPWQLVSQHTGVPVQQTTIDISRCPPYIPEPPPTGRDFVPFVGPPGSDILEYSSPYLVINAQVCRH